MSDKQVPLSHHHPTVEQYIASLPSNEVRKLAKTDDLKEFCEKINYHYKVVAACLNARFKGFDDPIEHWTKNKDGKLLHDFIWYCVDEHEALWQLVQISFKYIKNELEFYSDLNSSFDAFSLFLKIVATEADNEIMPAIYYQNVSVPKASEMWFLIRKATWSEFSSQERKDLRHLTNQVPENQWFKIVYNICRKYSKQDSLVADKLKDYRRAVSRVADTTDGIISRVQKGRASFKLPSYEWHNQERRIGNRHGGGYS